MSKAFLYGVGGSPKLLEKTFTENGTYNATSEGYDGYNPVTVNVSSEPTGYVRPTGVPIGEDIIANAPDIEQGGITYKPIYYICAMDTFNSVTFDKTATGSATGADAYVFSDEPTTLYVGTSVAHTFDATKDFDTSESWNCRYVIMYATEANKNNANGITVNLYDYKATFEMIGASGTIFSSSTPLFGCRLTAACKSIKYVDISNCSFRNNTVGNDFMGYCNAVVEIKLPNTIETTGGSFCRGCNSLTSLSLPELTTTGADFCIYCYSLTSLLLPELTTQNGNFCQNCYSLTNIDLSSITTLYSSSSNLSHCRFITLPVDFDIETDFTGATGYTKSLDWLNNELPTKLKDNSGGTAKTMTLGAANIALIGTTAAATIAAKNWTIA